MALSSLGVVFGVAFFIASQAQTEGFQEFFVETILGSKGAILIGDRFQGSYTKFLEKGGKEVVAVSNPQSRKYYPGINNAYRMIRVVNQFPNVKACSPIIEKNVVVATGFRNEVAKLQGIDLDMHIQTTDFEDQLTTGTIEDFRDLPDSIAVGSLLAGRLELRTGQSLYVIGPETNSRRFKVTNIFETGVNSIDEKLVITHRRAAQSVLHEPFLTSKIMVQLHDPHRAPPLCESLEHLLQHQARSWQEREKGTLQVFQVLRVSAGLAVSCIIMLAGFGIFNILTMSVLEKTKEIAILRSMGYTQQDIVEVFLLQGTGIAIVGIVFGWLAGAGLTYGISQMPVKIRGIFKADQFMVSWDWDHYLIAALLATVSVFIASFIPAQRAARVKPVNVIRGSSG